MFLFYKIFKKPVISEKTEKNCFGGTFGNFFGERGVLLPLTTTKKKKKK